VLNKVKIKGKRSRKQGTPYRHLETAATGRRVVTDLLG
jgi:hypothetical protein